MKNNPQKSIVDSFTGKWLAPLILLTMGIIFLTVGIIVKITEPF